MLDRLSPVGRNLALACLFALLAWFFWSVRSVLNPLILAYLLAFILHPLVLSLERRGWTRRAAVNLIFVTFLAVLSLLGLVFVQQGRAMVRALTAERDLRAGARPRRRAATTGDRLAPEGHPPARRTRRRRGRDAGGAARSD